MTSHATPTRLGRIVGIAFALASATALTSCGNAQTDEQYQAGVGANVRTGSVQLFNAVAVTNGDGTATLSASVLNRTGKTIKLTAASGTLSNGTKVTARTTPALIGAGQVKDTGPAGNVVIKASKLTAGEYLKLTLTFTEGNKATVDAPVVARSSVYADVATGLGGQAH